MDQKKLEELQIYEQNLQNIIMQKQIIQVELNEISNALSELEKVEKDIFRIIGGIMIKEEKEEVKKILEEKKKLLELRLKSFEKQEKAIKDKAEKIREEILKNIGK